MLTTGHKRRDNNQAVVTVDQPWCGNKGCSQRLWPPRTLGCHSSPWAATAEMIHDHICWETKPYWDDTSPWSSIDPGAILAEHLCMTQLACEEEWPSAMLGCTFCSSHSLYLLFLFPFPLICLAALLHLYIHPGVNHLYLIFSTNSCGNKDDFSSFARLCLFLSGASVCETDECILTFGWRSAFFFNASPPVCVRNTAVSLFLPVHSPTTIISMVQNVNPPLIYSFATCPPVPSAVIQNSSGPPDHTVIQIHH